MKALIGQKLVASLKPEEHPYEVRDTRLKGFLVRVQPSGIKTFICEYGRGKRMKIGSTEVFKSEKARDEAISILRDAAHGLDPLAERRKREARTFEEYVQRDYVPILTHRRRPKEVEKRLLNCFPDLKNVKLTDITAWQIEKWRSARKKAGIAASTINRELAELKAALAKAIELDRLADHPLKGIKLEKLDPNPKVRYLSPDEEKRLRATLAVRSAEQKAARGRGNQWRRQRGIAEMPPDPYDHLEPIVLLAMNTGLRRGELFELKWEDIDLGGAILTVHGLHTKNRKTRHVPLNSEALEVLKSHAPKQDNRKGYVFPSRNGKPLDTIKTAWGKVLDDAKIQNFRFHDLRHHFASKLVMAGVDLNTARELLGHGDIKMTLRYAHLSSEHKADAVAKLVQTETDDVPTTQTDESNL